MFKYLWNRLDTDGCSCSEVQDEQEMAPEDLMMVEMAASTRLLAGMG